MKEDATKNILRIIAVAVICTAAYWAFSRMEREDKSEADGIVSLTISKKEKLAKLATIKYSEDMLLFDVNLSGDTVAVIVARPELIMGTDIAALTENDFHINGDTLHVILPPVKVLQYRCNPSQREIVYASKDWNIDRRMRVLIAQAERKTLRDAVTQGIPERAGQNAIKTFGKVLQSCTDKVIQIEIRKEDTETRLPEIH